MRSSYFSIVVLMCVSMLAFAVTPLMMLVGSLLGAELAPSSDFATLPIAVMVVGTALGVLPATKTMQRFGRKQGLWLFLALGIMASLLASYSLVLRNFWLFCLAAMCIGFTNAALQQIRFAAIEVAPPEKATTATSFIMLSGIFAAFLGPELAVWGKDFTAVPYQGSFLLIAVSTVFSALILVLFKQTKAPIQETVAVARPIKSLLKSPMFCLAVCSGAIAYMVMTFVMTGTPISMHNHYHHSLVDTKWVIQSHIAAMFLPSLISPLLVRLMGLKGMMVSGLICYVLTVMAGFIDTSVAGFWVQLVLLGVGWNFLFVAGTVLLSKSYQAGEQYKAQSFNDSIVFSVQAMASLLAGLAISALSWQITLLVCMVPVTFMCVLLLRWRCHTAA